MAMVGENMLNKFISKTVLTKNSLFFTGGIL